MEESRDIRSATPSLAIIGGGAAGFFLAIVLKEMRKDIDITIYEQAHRVLGKVEISGGGRCNCTNSFRDIKDLKQAYPRGNKLMKRLMKQFGHEDAYRWFVSHGVPLVTQDDQCVFPKAQDSHAIIDCFMTYAHRYGVKIKTGCRISNIADIDSYDYIAVTTGGINGKSSFFQSLIQVHPSFTPLVPSLFTFNIKSSALRSLMGQVVEDAIVSIPGTKSKAQGPLLITHWGMSGPAILKLSSYAALHLADHAYKCQLSVNWTGVTNCEEVTIYIKGVASDNAHKLVSSIRPYGLPSRLWAYLLDKLNMSNKRWNELGNKGVNQIVNVLTSDLYQIDGKGTYKEEFVTCGGVDLKSIDLTTLESKHRPHLYFAGEVLDVDGITGGFNFQAAWTTAYAVARAIAEEMG